VTSTEATSRRDTAVALPTAEEAYDPTQGDAGIGASARPVASARQAATPSTRRRLEPRRAIAAVIGWLVVVAVAAMLVCYGFGSLFAQRAQRSLMASYRSTLYDASVTVGGIDGSTGPTLPPTLGSAVGILEIGAVHLQQVVTEGVSPSETEDGPGHVPGTSGLGQPGNGVVVGRRSGFGGSFAHLDSVKRGDEIVVTTTEGQSVYKVAGVATVSLLPGTTVAPSSSSGAAGIGGPADQSTAIAAPDQLGSAVAIDDLYGPSTDNRLTLVTSASGAPWNGSRATVVVAEMVGKPFTPTTQASRSDTFTGTNGDSGMWPALALVVLGYLAAAVGTVVAYRRYGARSAWLLTTAPLVVLTVLLAEIGTQLLPAWL
jgi:sortase A